MGHRDPGRGRGGELKISKSLNYGGNQWRSRELMAGSVARTSKGQQESWSRADGGPVTLRSRGSDEDKRNLLTKNLEEGGGKRKNGTLFGGL